MVRRIFTLCFCFGILSAGTAFTQDPIRFARTPDISPDGKTVVFSYLGDLWVVEAIGGTARPITMHEAHELNPSFSPDGRFIAFSSNRHGQYDVFVVPSYGGKPRRLTFDSSNDMVQGWSRDGSAVLFSSNRTTAYPGAMEMYSISMEGGQESRLPFREAKDAVYTPDGKSVVFVRGPGDSLRKNYRGSSNDDLWTAAADGSAVQRLSDYNGQDTSPMFSPDGKRLYYVSDVVGGTANIVVSDLSAAVPAALSGSPRPLTRHNAESVRRAKISRNGDWIVYECGGDLWIVSTRDGRSRMIPIEVHADEKANVDRSMTYTRDISEYALSPDESNIAFVVHGEVFVMPARGGKANRITDTPAVEHGLAWSPDNRKLIYISDRTGHEDVFLVESDDPDSTDLARATRFKTKALTSNPVAELGASFTTDGSRVAFIREGKLVTIKTDGTDEKVLVNTPQVFDYDWSPDGKWVVFARMDGSFASEMYIQPTEPGKPAINVSRYATYNADISWSQTGGRISFLSNRRNVTTLHVMSLQRPATPTGGTSGTTVEIDWEDIHLRVDRPTSMPVQEGSISRNGRLVAFRGSQGGDDLWIAASDGTAVSRVTTGSIGPRQIRWTRGGSIYFIDKDGALRNAMPSVGFAPGTAPPAPATVNFTAKLSINRGEEFQQMFDQAWRLLSDGFYDAGHHGADWRTVRSRYRELIPHIAMKEDLYSLISMMLGELNASHLGISGVIRTPDEITADLGLIFDDAYKGPGLKIAEVLKRGPADKRGINLKAGDVVLGLDRTELTPKTNLSRLLNGKINEVIGLDVTSNPTDPKSKRRVEVQAAGRDRIKQLMYDRWIQQNSDAVAKMSGGKVGYIHMAGMDDGGLEQFVRALYSDHFDKEAVVIDVRFNGGGFTHDQVLNYLGAKEHTIFRQRDGNSGMVLRSYDRKWTKPAVVLINNRSYSDAEIFPSAFRTLGYGKVVGQATGGMVIGTVATRLIDGSSFRLPRTGVWTTKGINMEREGVRPDVAIEAFPEDLSKGFDAQLSKAVEVVTADVAVWKKNKAAVAGSVPPTKDGGSSTTAAPMTPAKP